MKKFFLSAAFAAGGFLLAYAFADVVVSFVYKYPSNEITQADHQLARDATWAVHCFGKPCGTAAQVKPGIFLTAAHITQADMLPPKADDGEEVPPRLTVSKDGGATLHELETVFDNKTTDVALVRADTDCPCVPVANTPPQQGVQAFTVGYPFTFTRDYTGTKEAIITEGRVQERLRPPEEKKKEGHTLALDSYLTSIWIFTGNSGGGMFVKQGGKIVVAGVASRGGYRHERGSLGQSVKIRYRQLGMFAAWESIQEALMHTEIMDRLDRLESALDKTFGEQG